MKPLIFASWSVLLLCSGFAASAQSPVSLNAAGDYVIRFDVDGVPREFVFERGTHIRPEVRVVITRDAGGSKYLYRYSVGNGQGARQEIHSFTIRDAADAVVKNAPPEWDGDVVSQRARAYWLRLSKDRKRGVPAGAIVEGFTIESSLLPGPTTAELRGAVEVPRIPPVLPESALVQLRKLLSEDFVAVATIGPVIRGFSPQEPELTSAVFLARLKTRFSVPLIRSGDPDAEEVARLLDVAIKSTEGGGSVIDAVRPITALARKRTGALC